MGKTDVLKSFGIDGRKEWTLTKACSNIFISMKI